MGQIPLPFSNDLASDDFIVTACNEQAASMLQNWQYWPYGSAIIQGPEKSGKTVMGGVFANMSSGRFIDNFDVLDETEVFHSWNSAHQNGQPILLALSAQGSVDDIALPDLKSRLKASQIITIGPPDEAMMSAMFEKLCHNSGLNVNERMAHYVATHCERSYAGIVELVSALNHWALANKKPINMRTINGMITGETCDESSVI